MRQSRPGISPNDIVQASADGSVTGIGPTVDSTDSVAEVSALLDAFEDHDVQIGTLVVEIR